MNDSDDDRVLTGLIALEIRSMLKFHHSVFFTSAYVNISEWIGEYSRS